MYDDVDLEDLECRLYSQVYHIENEDVSLPPESNVAAFDYDKVHNSNRYFFEKHIPAQPTFISLEEENSENTNNSDKTYPLVHNSVSVNPNSTDIVTEGNIGSQFQNNITVNQYNLPLIINPELNEVLDPERYFVPWAVSKNLIEKKKRRNQKWRNRKRKNKKTVTSHYNTRSQARENAQRNLSTNYIVYVSDNSENECVIVNETCIKAMNSIEQPKVLENLESGSDDDIIYIPPPPVEVINVDPDNEEEKIESVSETISDITEPSSTDPTVLSNKSDCQPSGPVELSNNSESCAFNDFLDNSGVENGTHKFNFSLHGSDFNNAGDFVRPANPIEYCETESSCSTNEFNKENNSFKTIVFNEVDFPREDIFSDKNLEGFSTYITPKRSTSKKSKVASTASKPAAKSVNEDESSLSSSESDYEPSDTNKNKIGDDQFNKRLPTLSPMHCEKVDTPKTSQSRRKSLKITPSDKSKARKDASKRKSDALDNTESLTDSDKEEPEIIKKPKKKKKTCGKKKNSSGEADADDGNNSNAEISDSEKYTKRKSKNSQQSEESVKESNDEISDHSNNINKEDCLKSTDQNTENLNSDSLNTSHKKKRKKKKSVSSENTLKVQVISESTTDINNTNIENELSNDKNISTLDSSSLIVPHKHHEQEDLVLSTKEIESKSDSDKTVTKKELQNVEETSNCVVEEPESNEAIIVVDEMVSRKSKTNEEDCIEIVESSDSEFDFKQLNDVGQDLELANCSVGRKEFSDDDARFLVKNRKICEINSEFDVEQVQSTQSDDPEVWKILAKDRAMFLNINTTKGPRCNRCRHFGHIAVKCMEKPDPPKCTLCASSDHLEPRCPNKMCTQCGNQGDYSTTFCWKCIKFRNCVCRICHMRGHIGKTCPDLWRRYHLTTQEGPIVISQEPQLKPRDQLWCSGCAGHGHLEHECNYYNREYPPITPCIINYEDVLYEEDRNKVQNATPLPLPSPPVWDIQVPNNYRNLSPFSTSPNNLYRNPSPFDNIPSTSQGVPYSNQIFIPPIMGIPNLNPIVTIPAITGPTQIAAPNHNIIPVSTRVLNPYSVLAKQHENVLLDRMMSDYVNDGTDIDFVGCIDSDRGKVIQPHMLKYGASEFVKNEQKKVRQTIISMPPHVVKQFLSRALHELENVVSRSDPKYLRKKLFKYDKISQSKKVLSWEVVKEKCFWYRILNMYIFGVHHFKDGKMHVSYIKKYLSEPKQNKLDFHKRKSLLNAYNYIFDPTRHISVNYYKIIQQLIAKYNERS